MFGTSTFLGALRAPGASLRFPPRARRGVGGGEAEPRGRRACGCAKFGLRIMEGYGATECAPVISLNTPLATGRARSGACCPASSTASCRCPGIARGGVLHVRGPNVMRGYYLYERAGRAAAAAVRGGRGLVQHRRRRRPGRRRLRHHTRARQALRQDRGRDDLARGRGAHRAARLARTTSTPPRSSWSRSRARARCCSPPTRRSTASLLQKAARELGAQDLAVARRVVHVRHAAAARQRQDRLRHAEKPRRIRRRARTRPGAELTAGCPARCGVCPAFSYGP